MSADARERETDPGGVLADVTAMLRAGLAPAQAWEIAGVDVDDEGIPDAGWAGARASPAVAMVAASTCAASRLAREAGVPLVAVLGAIDGALARELEARDAMEAALAGPRMSARILRWLPAVGVALAAFVDPGALGALAASPAGWALAGVAALLTWAGSAWMSRMVGRAGGEGRGRDAPASLPVSVTLALVEAALGAGLDAAGACRRVAAVVDEDTGAALRALARDVSADRMAEQAAGAAGRGLRVPGAVDHPVALALSRPLALAALTGAPAAHGIRAAAVRLDREQRRAAQRAAGELGVRLTLPLAACLLPAFALAGVVPMVIAVVSGAGLGEIGTVVDGVDVPAPSGP